MSSIAHDLSQPTRPAEDVELNQQSLAQTLGRILSVEGLLETPVDGLTLFRADSPMSCTSAVYEPCLGFIVQGSKSLQFGDREIIVGPLSFIAASVHLPVAGNLLDASPESPYLGIKLTLDPQEITDLVLDLGDRAPVAEEDFNCDESSCGMRVAQMDRGIVDALDRLVRMVEAPADAPILAPMVRRELLYRALMTDMGPHLRKLAVSESQANRISRVIAVLKDRFSEPLRVSELAEGANMSESSFYHSFKQVTRMSPLQFQKKLRLHEARRLMLTEGLEAASASYRVGYESPSHFSREYSRMFGAPPRADVNKLRGEQRIPA